MLTILDLPNELLLQVYTACPNVPTAVNLAATNRRLHQFFLDNSHDVVTQILRPTIDAFDEALELAVQEIRDASGQTSSQPQIVVSPDPTIPISTLVHKLRENDSLAASAVEGYHAFVAELSADNFRHGLSLTSLSSAYYLVRRLVSTARSRHAEDEPIPEDRLNKLSDKEVTTALMIIDFLLNFTSVQENERQGCAKDKADWLPEDELVALPCKDEWEDAADFIQRMNYERLYGKKVVLS